MKSPILLDIAESFESERLKMRCPMPGDGPELYDAELETFDGLRRWFGPWSKEMSTLEQAEERVRKCRSQFLERAELAYNCYLKENQRLAGRGWFTRIEWSVPKCMFGYWVRSSLQRRGLGLEMMLAFLSFGIEQIAFKRIELYIDPRNEPVYKVIKEGRIVFRRNAAQL